MLEITPNITDNQTIPFYQQLYQYIRDEIHSGRFSPGTRMPSVRDCAKNLHLSRNTIESAYQQLLAEGYLVSRPRQGLFVSMLDQEFVSMPVKNSSGSCSTSPIRSSAPISGEPSSEMIHYDFRNGDVDFNHFPLEIWRRLSNQSLAEESSELFHYGDFQGDWELRQEIAKYLHQSRGVNCSPEQIVLGAGIQYLLGILCLLVGPEFRDIAVEDPGYLGAKTIFRNHGCDLHPVSLQEDGLDLEQLSASAARLVYITPSHQFPCGMVLPIVKRLKLLQWAQANNGFIIEDDYDGEFRYYQKPIPSLQGLDRSDRVIYLGTFSKSLLPSIRMGYMILPHQLLEPFCTRFAGYEQSVSRLHQRTLQLFMQKGYWARHIRKMRVIYQKKQSALVNAIREYLDERVQLVGSEAGLHILLQVRNGMSEAKLIAKAANQQVRVYPTSHLWLRDSPEATASGPISATILLGYGGMSETQIREGILRLAKAWFE
ncbi:PLP-dependent aminotransferase family protein [Brevibacillus ginsengisoli]|uniref:MocR-like pyridoxine biosynthesis transcription factor PdxR n=1 Tax=Brevibacillus ginsengisoli TaxID=363854 RepID=UPI003CEB4C72